MGLFFAKDNLRARLRPGRASFGTTRFNGNGARDRLCPGSFERRFRGFRGLSGRTKPLERLPRCNPVPLNIQPALPCLRQRNPKSACFRPEIGQKLTRQNCLSPIAIDQQLVIGNRFVALTHG
jgi:hypothetical protein